MKTLTKAIFVSFLFIAFTSNAQDYIHKKNREILKVKIIEISSDEIKFKDFDNPNYPVFVIEKAKVSKLELESGDILEIKTQDSFNDPDYYTGQSKNALKVSFTGFFNNQAAVYYERSLTPSTSFEVGLAYIGGGFDPNEKDAKGASFRAGFKFKPSPEFYISKMRYSHVLGGGYVKPELILSTWSEKSSHYDHISGKYQEGIKSSRVSGAFIINLGAQSVLADAFLIDYYSGFGFGFSENRGTNHGFSSFEDIPLVLAFGLNIGFVFNDKN